MIPIDKLAPNPGQPRIEIGDLSELISSIKQKGVLEPLLVRPSDVGGRFMIISGERRYRASLEAGLTELPCIEMDVDDRDVAEISLIENLQRKDLTPFEEADGLRTLGERFGYTHEEIATKIGKSRTTITEALSISAIPKEIRDLCRRADITSKSMLLQIVRQPTDEDMRALIAEVRDKGLTRDDVRNVRQGKVKKDNKFVYKYKAKNQAYSVMVTFRKTQVEKEHVRQALMDVLDHLNENEEE
jgi:ParB family chromosome partitioning protein